MATRRCGYCGSTRGVANASGDWVCYACGQITPALRTPAPSAASAGITVTCWSCGSVYQINPNVAGNRARCVKCGTLLKVGSAGMPSYGQTQPAPAAPAPGGTSVPGSYTAGVPGNVNPAMAGPGASAGSMAPTVAVSQAPPPPAGSNNRRVVFMAFAIGAPVLTFLALLVLVIWALRPASATRESRRGNLTAREEQQPTKETKPPNDHTKPASSEPRKPGKGQPGASGTPPQSGATQPVPPRQPPISNDTRPQTKPLNPQPEHPPAAKPPELKDLFAKLAPSVPLVLAKLDDQRGGHGSGFVIRHNGNWYVATNNHVVEVAASGLELFFLNDKGRLLFRASSPRVKIARMSKEADVALIDCNQIAEELTKHNIEPVKLPGRDYQPAVGEKVFAIGHPGAGEKDLLPQTLTEGIVSGVGRQLDELRPMRFIQTTASVNPGNSGGPLFDFTGQVVGINTLVIRRSPNREVNLEGLNFALEVRHLHDLLADPGLSFTEQEIQEMLRRRVRGPVAKPVQLEPKARLIVDQQVIVGPFQQQRFDLNLQAGEVCILAAQPLGVDLVRLSLVRQNVGVLNGVQTFDNPPLLYKVDTSGRYTLWVANPNFVAAVVVLKVGVVRPE